MPNNMNDRKEIYYYGNVGIERAKCGGCGRMSFVLKDNKTACCGFHVEYDGRKPIMKGISQPEQRRIPLRGKEKQRILKEQNYLCAYCIKEFGSIMYREGQEIYLSVEFDHKMPYAYNQDNKPRNYIAACQVCNGLKGSLIFKDLAQAREYLRLARKDKGYEW